MGIVFAGGAEGSEMGSDGEVRGTNWGTFTFPPGRGVGGYAWSSASSRSFHLPFSVVPATVDTVRIECATFFPTDDGEVNFIIYCNGSSAQDQLWIRKDKGRDDWIFSRRVSSNTVAVSPAGSAPAGVWESWHFEVKIGNAPDGEIHMYKNSDLMTPVLSLTGLDTRDNNSVSTLGVSIEVEITGGALLDDIIIIDPSDGTGWTGCPQLVGAGATSDGSQVAAWTPTGASVFASVNAIPADADKATSLALGDELLLTYAQPAVGTPITWISTVTKAQHTTPGVHKITTETRDTAAAATFLFASSTSVSYSDQYTKTRSFSDPNGNGWDRDVWTWEFGLITA